MAPTIDEQRPDEKRDHEQRRARIRRNALLFALVALAFYFGFILMGYLRS